MMTTKSQTTGVTPLDNFHSDELRAELARRDAITEEAVQLYKSLTQTTAPHPYQAGYRDRCKNAVAWDNPYPLDTWRHYAWQSGWEQCSVHIEQDGIEDRMGELWIAENE